jgi:type 2 lantibiotic biosynthesis protein LanM
MTSVRMLTLPERAAAMAGRHFMLPPSASHDSREAWWTDNYFRGDGDACHAFFKALGLEEIAEVAIVEKDDPIEFSFLPPSTWREMLEESRSADYWSRLADDPGRRKALAGNFGTSAVVVPFISAFTRKLSTALAGMALSGDDRGTIERCLIEHVSERLQQAALPTAMLMINIARVQRLNEGDSPEERCRTFASALLDQKSRAALLKNFPSLDRLLAEIAAVSLEAGIAFAQHYARDRVAIEGWAGAAMGPLTAVRFGVGDAHQRGRTVAIVECANLKIVYKPRSLAVDTGFAKLLAWLDARISNAPVGVRILERDSCGWAAFVEHRACETIAEVSQGFERLGALLAALHLVGASDMHFENVIFDGAFPFAVDLETLLSARPPLDPASDFIARSGLAREQSVLWIGYLPSPIIIDGKRIDLSAAGAVEAQPSPIVAMQVDGLETDNPRLEERDILLEVQGGTPMLDGRRISAHGHVDAILRGFDRAYRAFLEEREDLLAADGPLASFADVEVRYVARPTVTYARLLRSSYHPSVARDAAERSMSFAGLWHQVAGEPHLARLIAFECRDLWSGDVPHFRYRGSSTTLLASDGTQLHDFFERSGYDRMRDRASALTVDDLARQQSVIRQAFRSSNLTGGPEQPGAPVAPARMPPALLVEHAARIGDQLCREAFLQDGMPYWFAATNLTAQNYGIGLTDASVYDGVAGIGIFFAELAQATGDPAHRTMALRCLDAVRRTNPEARGRAISAYEGHAGLVYAERRMARALAEIPDAATTTARLRAIRDQAGVDDRLDVIGGAAGALLVALGCRDSHPDLALDAAERCAGRLKESAIRSEAGAAWAAPNSGKGLTGFSHGACGMAASLFAFAAASGDSEARDLARDALRFERSTLDGSTGRWRDQRAGIDHATGWCHGAPGMVLGRLQIRAIAPEAWPDLDIEIELGLRDMIDNAAAGSHCLCHGALGNAETFLLAGPRHHAFAQGLAARAIEERTAERRWRCGIADFAETPGLLVGLAGIGLGLLRVANPDLASVLTLDCPA